MICGSERSDGEADHVHLLVEYAPKQAVSGLGNASTRSLASMCSIGNIGLDRGLYLTQKYPIGNIESQNGHRN